MNLNYIIKRPIITEKSLEATKNNCYTFEVDYSATKDQIKASIKQLFKVDAITVRTLIAKPISKSNGKRRLPGFTSTSKKAIVQLKSGQTIKVFETKG